MKQTIVICQASPEVFLRIQIEYSIDPNFQPNFLYLALVVNIVISPATDKLKIFYFPQKYSEQHYICYFINMAGIDVCYLY